MAKIGRPTGHVEKAHSQLMIPRRVQTEGLEDAPYALAWALQCSGAKPKIRILKSIADAREGQLPLNELWLWVGHVPDLHVDDMQNLGQMIDEATRTRLSRLARKQDQASIGIAHASVRLLLGAILDVSPSKIDLRRGRNNKPYLVSPKDNLHFNLSHTEGALAVALAREPLGVDIEMQRDLPDLLEIAETVFAPETAAAITNASGGTQRRLLFYRHWTLGEALIKATGGGMSHDLKSFAFSSQGSPKLCRATGEFRHADRWEFGIHGVGK